MFNGMFAFWIIAVVDEGYRVIVRFYDGIGMSFVKDKSGTWRRMP